MSEQPQSRPQFSPGDRCFSHYTSHPAAGISGWGTVMEVGHTYRDQTHGITGDPLPDTTWYRVRSDEGKTDLLDDAHGDWRMARIVPQHVAKRWGHGIDPNPDGAATPPAQR